MNTPEQYLLDEWDTLCARANKSLHSDCPLLEDEVLVAMHKYVSEQEARISALEEFVGIISKGIPNVPNLTETYVKLAIDLLREKPEKTEKLYIVVNTSRYETLGKNRKVRICSHAFTNKEDAESYRRVDVSQVVEIAVPHKE